MKAIAQLVNGERARIQGRIRMARRDALTAPLSERTCVYWDVRPHMSARPERMGSQPFWVEDATGKILVPGQGIEIVARGAQRKALIDRASADIHQVTSRIRELKTQLKATHSKALMQERQHLAKVATLLCAIRAHARGNVHGGGSLEAQQRFIDSNVGLVQTRDLGNETIQMLVQRVEVVLTDGDEVVAEGLFRAEPLPPDVGAQGYRERPTCLTLRGDAVVRGVGAAAPAEDELATPDARAEPLLPPPHRDPIVRATAFIIAALGLAYYWLG